MADTSTYPGALDGDLKGLATAHVTAPPGAIDFLELVADAVAKIETELGTNPSGAAASVAAAIAALAPLASPAFTGTPTAPTAAGGTSSTQLATTAFVAAALAALVDSSPAALDTLNELAAALGDDPNFATTVTNALAAKLDTATAATTYAPLETTPTVEEMVGSSHITTSQSSTLSFHMFAAPFALEVVAFSLFTTAGVSASDVDYWEVTLRRYRDAAATNIVTKTTQATGGSTFSGNRDWNFDAETWDTAAATFQKGDLLNVSFVKVGAPTAMGRTGCSWRYVPL